MSKQVEYDFSACNLRVSDVVYHLTMLENKIFSILCKNRNTLVAREDLLKAGWNSQAPNCSLQLNKMVSRLRKLLKGDHSVYILTEKPLGLKSNNKRDVSCNEVAGTVAFYRRVPV